MPSGSSDLQMGGSQAFFAKLNHWLGAATPRPDVGEEQPLRLELFNLDQLRAHAKALAARHEVAIGLGPDLLLPRLADNEMMLIKAYEVIVAGVQGKQRISPAGEWLLDNFHLIEEQIRIAKRHLPKGYSRELPHLSNGENAGLPRVYDIALETIAHVDGRVDQENITAFVGAYQQVSPLRLGEFWAIPIMLRLALIENLRRVATRVATGMRDRQLANHWADGMLQVSENDPRNLLLAAADMARSRPPMSNSFVAEFVRRLRGLTPALDIPLTWIEQQLAEKGLTTEQTVQLESHQQAANQVSVGASIGSLRFLAAMDWREFVEGMSEVEQLLRLDPARVYASMDFSTRDRYRHVTERLAKRSGLTESEVARRALALAQAAAYGEDSQHVGYYLIGEGLPALLGQLPSLAWSDRLRLAKHRRAPYWSYFGAILLVTLLLCLSVSSTLGSIPSGLATAMMTMLMVVVASQVAVAVCNWAATLLVAPRTLPRLDFSKGIPATQRAVIAVPSLLVSTSNVEQLLDALEVRYLANRDEALRYVLLTDFVDAPTPTLPEDTALLAQAEAGIAELNARYKAEVGDVFFLCHRARTWNEQEQLWMGHERKRGKLEALNKLLRLAPSTQEGLPFQTITGRWEALVGAKYVITLDADTNLPRDAAQLLVSTMAHPLNRPRLDERGERVVKGYGILQPRVGTNLATARRSWFVRVFAEGSGIDPYTRAVSDVYQDLFGEGSFVGKGIYDVDALTTTMAGKLPENLILSHDLLEGCYARCGFVSDVLLYEDFPHHYGQDVQRRRRWLRGDWQIAAWLLPRVPTPRGWTKNPLTFLARWKIFDNLRRSAVPIATTLLLLSVWCLLDQAWPTTVLIAGLAFLPPLLASLAGMLRRPADAALAPHLRGVLAALGRMLMHAVLTVIFLPYDALISLHSIGCSCTRMLVTKRRLLEWQSATDPRYHLNEHLLSFYLATPAVPLASVLALIGLLTWRHATWQSPALPFVGAWALTPALAWWLSRQLATPRDDLSASQTLALHLLTRKTWRFFEAFVDAGDHFLPPDNFQEYPAPVTAHRTSPTNIGLAVLCNLGAYDFAYISAETLLERTAATFASMEKLERFRGHFYNWYDTQTLRPLLPLYVSTVDSGNLAGLLLTLRPGLKELPEQPIISRQLPQGLLDTLAGLADTIKNGPLAHDDDLQRALSRSRAALQNRREEHAEAFDLAAILRLQTTVHTITADLAPRIRRDGDEEARWWLNAWERQEHDCLSEPLSTLAPWAALPPLLADDLGADGKPASGKDWTEILEQLPALALVPTRRQIAELRQRLVPLIDDVVGGRVAAQPRLAQLRQGLATAGDKASQQILTIARLIEQLNDFALMEYDFLYDKSRHLLTIGYNVSEHRRDGSFYDLLASEARLCSFVAVAQGVLPQEHWFALGRLLTTCNGDSTLLSWSGSMFEYLMPLLVMPTFPATLLDQTYTTVIKRQIEYGAQCGVPWGISESGYNTTDANLNYQYRAFGVPGLGFKRGLAEDIVIAPYATVMALMVNPRAACANMAELKARGYEGRYGFYEAIDFTPSRLTSDQNCAIVRSFMAHHQGMSFLSLAYHLLDQPMQRRFLADPLFKATELLLHERVPKVATFYPHAPEVSGVSRLASEREASLRVIPTPNTPRPEVHLLSNGRYAVMVTNSGGGYSRWQGLALTRWREDPTRDPWGTFCYVRDADTGKVWSAAHQPTLAKAEHYEAIFPLARAEFRRRDYDLEMHTEITVSPEDDIELRRLSLTNLTNQTRTIELTSYAEVVLAPQAADEAHPAFSNLFVQTEILPDKRAILCTRRPRSDRDKTPVLLHLMVVHEATTGAASFETDRSRFIGRGRTSANPLMMDRSARDWQGQRPADELSGQDGSVLDPIVAIRRSVTIAPEQTVHVHIVTGVGEDRDKALALVGKYQDRHLADRVFELAWTHRQVVLRQLNVTEVDAQLYSRLASSVLYVDQAQRASRTILSKNRRGQSSLWGYGISGDLPIVVVKISDQERIGIVRQLVQAHSYWRMLGLNVDLVIWNEDDSGYRQVLHDQIMSLIAASEAQHLIDKAGGIFIRRAEQMSEEDQILIQTIARVIITDTGGTLAEQVERRRRVREALPVLVPTKSRGRPEAPDTASSPAGPFANGLGCFSEDGREYHIVTSPQQLTPAPWVNVLANPYFGSVVSESGGAYTWCENAHEFRLTPWHNDALTDESGEAFYLRDEESGEAWSPTPLPIRSSSPYLTCHGFGYSVFEVTHGAIASALTSFVAIDAPVKLCLIKLKNTSPQVRRLSLTGYCAWALGDLRTKSLLHIVSEVDPATSALFARNPYHPEFGARVGFFDVSEKVRTVTADRSEFIGRNGNLANPDAMTRQQLSGRVGAALDPCAAVQTLLELQPGEEREVVFILGVGRDGDDARTLIRRFRSVPQAYQALTEVKRSWERTLGAVQVTTPDPAVNILTNGWLLYQVVASRLWARSGYYQSGGAYGFRDQLQDTMAMLHSEPYLLRSHILRCAAHQFRDGDVQHWWHPPSGRGVRTHFSDDYLWLPLATSRYVLGTHDKGVLDIRTNFIEGRNVKPDEEAYMDLPARSEEAATLYEHCVRAINRGLKFGAHGMPLIGCGDWNDGMNLVGEHGKGESVWLAFFLFDVLQQFALVADLYEDAAYAAHCRTQATELQARIEANAWDGNWYLRAFFDNGTPLGSSHNSECQIDALPQSWSILSGAGNRERSRRGMEALDSRLVDRPHQLIKLFDPPFDKSEPNPGYIKGYVPGVRENGGQYTHAAVWSAMAFAALGDEQRAWELLRMILPINHAMTHSQVAVYKVEPYVMAADVYAVPPQTGRGGWTWYTGSAGWMYRLIIESLLGLRLEVSQLTFHPCIPSDWQEFKVRYRYRETFYDITIHAHGKAGKAVENGGQTRVVLDGTELAGSALMLLDDHQVHHAEVYLGKP